MLSNKEVSRLYETMLKSEWMKGQVKLSFKVSRREILVLSQIVEKGLSGEDAKGIFSEDSIASIRGLTDEMLSKAGLNELKEIPLGKVTA